MVTTNNTEDMKANDLSYNNASEIDFEESNFARVVSPDFSYCAQQLSKNKLLKRKILKKFRSTFSDEELEYFNSLLKPQGVDVNHIFKWQAGDRVINSVCDYLSPPEIAATEFHTIGEESNCGNGNKNANSFLDVVKSIFNVVFSSFGSFDSSCLYSLLTISLLTYSVRRDKLSASLFFVLLTFLLLKFLTEEESAFLRSFDFAALFSSWEKLSTFVSSSPDDELEMEVMVPQGLEEVLPSFGAVLLSCLYLITGYKAKSSILDALHTVSKVNEGQIKNTSAFLLSLSSKLSDFFERMDMSTIAKYFYVELVSDENVREYIGKVNKFVASLNAGCPSSEAYYIDVYEDLCRAGKKLADSLDKKTTDYSSVRDCIKSLESANKKVVGLRAALSGSRVEPVGILIKGPPGVFKSVLCSRLITVVTKMTMPEDWVVDYERDPKSFLYSVPVDKFFDGYTPKAWVALFDDIYQARDAVGTDSSDALKTIKMINSQPYTLQMADVGSKNSTFFRSPFVFATTNLTNFSLLQSVQDYQAVERRWHIELNIKTNPYFLDEEGKVDFMKLPNADSSFLDGDSEISTFIPNDFWLIDVVERRGNSSVLHKDIAIDDVINLIVEKHYSFIKNYHINARNESQLAADLTAKVEDNKKRRSRFAAQMKRTYEPQGLSSSDPNSKEYGSFEHYFSDLSFQYQRRFLNDFFEMCYSGFDTPRMDLFDHGIKGIDLHIKRFDPTLDLFDLTDPKGSFNMCVYLNHSYRRVELAGYCPFTGEKLTQVLTSSEKVVASIRNSFKKVLKVLWDYKYVLLTSGLFATGLYWIVGFLKSMLVFDAQSIDMKTTGMKIGKPNVGKLSTRLDQIHVIPQGMGKFPFEFDILPKVDSSLLGSPGNTNDVIAKTLNKYMYIVYLVVPSDDIAKPLTCTRLGHAINVSSTYFLVPLHFVYQINTICNSKGYSGAQIVFSTVTRSNKYVITAEDFVVNFSTNDYSAERDICIVNVLVAHRNSIGMLNHFLTENDVEYLNRNRTFQATILGTYSSNSNSASFVVRNNVVRASINNDVRVKTNWEKEDYIYILSCTAAYKGSFGSGDCGSLLVVDFNNFSNRCFAGIHVAGGSNDGHSTFLTRELIEELLKSVPGFKRIPFVEEESGVYYDHVIMEPQGNMSQVGKLFSHCSYKVMSSSEIKKSKFHSKLPSPHNVVKTIPCKLRPFERDGILIDPVHESLKHYGKEPVCIPYEFLQKAKTSYEALIFRYSKRCNNSKKLLTFDESIHVYDNLNSISSSTSAGYPMVVDSFDNLKKNYFSAIAENCVDKIASSKKAIEDEASRILELYSKGIRPVWLYKDTLKDQKKDREKVLAGSGRMFSGVPFILLYLFKVYFGSFMSEFYYMNLDVGSAIGINPYSAEWDTLARKLLKFSTSSSDPCIGAGDYSKYDAHLQPSILQAVLDIVNNWYGYGDLTATNIRTQLWAEITNSKHVFNNVVYEWFSSMPSGNPMTAIINTIANNLIFRIAFQFADLDIDCFNDNVYMVALGDDNAFSVSEAYRENFNEFTLKDLMSQCGFVYTTEFKEDAVTKFRSLCNVEFLKRTFRYDKSLGLWLSPLRLEAITEMLNWTKKGPIGDQIAVDNAVIALRELTLHGKEVYDYWFCTLTELAGSLYPDVHSNGDYVCDHFEALKKVTQDVEYRFELMSINKSL